MSKLDEALDLLREARRYVRRNPDEAQKLIDRALDCAFDLPDVLADRLAENLYVGIHFVLVDHDVLGGYIDGAILEIQDYQAKGNK